LSAPIELLPLRLAVEPPVVPVADPVADPVEDPVALPVDPGDALDALPELEPAGDTSVRMKPALLALLDAPPVVAEPDVPAVELPDRRQPLSVTVCAELDPAVDPDCPVGVCPPDWADAATASAAENTVPNIK
jgi:hypothetical protein